MELKAKLGTNILMRFNEFEDKGHVGQLLH